MDAVDAIVMPSRYEAMSYVMLEAAAAAKPLILHRRRRRIDRAGARPQRHSGRQ